MEDKISSLARELSDYSQYHHLEKKIKVILKKLQIVQDKEYVKCGHHHKNTDNCTFFCSIESSHNYFGEKIDILVKPDHSTKRVLRVLIEVGNEIFQKSENKDNWNRNDKKVFTKEEKSILKDIIHFLKRKKKRVA